MKVNSKRLELIKPKLKHFERLYEICFSDAEVMEYVGNKFSKSAAKEFYVKYFLELQEFEVLILKKNQEIIGYGGVCEFEFKEFSGLELGYVLGKEYWGIGYATEIAKAQLDFILYLEKDAFATAHPNNIGSKRILEKIGMKIVDSDVNMDGRGLRDVYRFL